MGGIVNEDDASILQGKPIADARDGENDGKIIFPLHPFLYDFEMEETKKPAPEALSQGDG